MLLKNTIVNIILWSFYSSRGALNCVSVHNFYEWRIIFWSGIVENILEKKAGRQVKIALMNKWWFTSFPHSKWLLIIARSMLDMLGRQHYQYLPLFFFLLSLQCDRNRRRRITLQHSNTTLQYTHCVTVYSTTPPNNDDNGNDNNNNNSR